MLNKKLLATVCAAGMFTAANSHASDEGKLLIWVMAKAESGMIKIAEQFTAETGIPATIERPEDLPSKFETGAAAGKGPDLIMWAHDRMGGWAETGLLDTISPSVETQKSLIETGWEAFTYNQRVMGYPISVEAVGLIYNKKFIDTPPTSFEEIFALDKKLKAEHEVSSIMWDYNNTYFTWPLLAANGGYVFGGKAGQYDPEDIGVNSKGAVTGAEMLKKLIDEGVMPKGIGYQEMEAAFAREETAMMINGPWAWGNAAQAGIDFGVAAVPSINGNNAKPFVGVIGLMINRSSKNKEVAREFIEQYVLTPESLAKLDEGESMGTPVHKEYFAQRSADPNIKSTMANVEAGKPMPNHPNMGLFWSAMAAALENITNGRQSPEDALNDAAKRINPELEAE